MYIMNFLVFKTALLHLRINTGIKRNIKYCGDSFDRLVIKRKILKYIFPNRRQLNIIRYFCVQILFYFQDLSRFDLYRNTRQKESKYVTYRFY